MVMDLHPDHIELFYNMFARKAPNYFFNPKFKMGAWDGNIRYFSRTGKTHVYLLPEIVPKLQSLGYKFNLIDNRKSDRVDVEPITENHLAHIEDLETGEPIKLRYYQVEGANALIANEGGICIAGTGAGKTMINAVLADVYGKAGLRTITIVPNQDLVKQTRRDFLIWGLDTGEYSGTAKELRHTHVISTWQALQNNPLIIKDFDVIIVDECHGLKGNVLTKLLNEHGKHIAYRFGLTGTLPKAETDAMAVRIAIGDVQYEIHAHQLIEQEYLAKMKIDIFQLVENREEEYQEYLAETDDLPPMTYTQFKDSYYPEWTAEKRFLQGYAPRLEWIANLIEVKRDVRKGNVLCLVDGVAFGKRLAKLVDGAIFVHGKDKQKARKEIYDLFDQHDDIVVIATIQIASTGLNIKRIFNMMFIDVGKSFIRVIQTIGRGLRKAHDKDTVSVTDICSDLKYSKRHLRERSKFYREAKYPYKKHKVEYDEER